MRFFNPETGQVLFVEDLNFDSPVTESQLTEVEGYVQLGSESDLILPKTKLDFRVKKGGRLYNELVQRIMTYSDIDRHFGLKPPAPKKPRARKGKS